VEEDLKEGDLVQVKDGFERPPIYPYKNYGVFVKYGEKYKYGAQFKTAFVYIEGQIREFDSPYWILEKVE
jgi:hypothetical protein